jgi:hypothetical protein
VKKFAAILPLIRQAKKLSAIDMPTIPIFKIGDFADAGEQKAEGPVKR